MANEWRVFRDEDAPKESVFSVEWFKKMVARYVEVVGLAPSEIKVHPRLVDRVNETKPANIQVFTSYGISTCEMWVRHDTETTT